MKKFQFSYLSKSQRGFTFIELLAALTILALVIGIATPAIFQNVKKGRIKAAHIQINGFEQALNSFNLDCGYFPTTEQGLEALLKAPSSGKTCKNYDSEGYLKQKTLPSDPFTQPYIYASPGQHNPSSYDLSSPGPDKIPGNEDDITNWE